MNDYRIQLVTSRWGSLADTRIFHVQAGTDADAMVRAVIKAQTLGFTVHPNKTNGPVRGQSVVGA